MVLSVDCGQITQPFQAEVNRCFFNQLQVDIRTKNPNPVFLEFSNSYIIAMTSSASKVILKISYTYNWEAFHFENVLLYSCYC